MSLSAKKVRIFMFSLRTILCQLGALFAGVVHAADPSARLYINYSRNPSPQDLLACELSILDPHAKADLKPGHDRGHRFLAYLSLVELAKGSLPEVEAVNRGVPFLAANDHWESHVMDVTSSQWNHFMLDDVAAPAIAKGFDGFFLDTVDAVSHSVFKDKSGAREAVIQMVRELHQRWPTKPIVVNRGFELLDALSPLIAGVLVESVYQSFDPATKSYQTVPEEGTKWVETQIRKAQARKLQVYVVDYVEPTNQRLADETVQRILKLGCIPLITTPGLEGRIVAPAVR